jgi:hypothetical protein
VETSLCSEKNIMANTIAVNSVDEAKQVASQGTGPFLVLSQETLDQIEAAEAAGGFEGGMSGASGQGGFSAPGSGDPNSSSSSDPVPTELLDLDGAVPVGAFFEGVVQSCDERYCRYLRCEPSLAACLAWRAKMLICIRTRQMAVDNSTV